MTGSLIVKVIQHYYPDWEAPVDRGRVNYSCLCPFHGDSRPSGSVSYEKDCFNCFVCDEGGSAIDIIMREEGIGYREALEVAEGISPGSNEKIQEKSSRKPSRRAFGGEGTRPSGSPSGRKGGEVPAGVRSRTTPWA